MATFQPPFLASNQIALAKKIVNDSPAPLPSALSSELRFLIMKMLEKDPTRRPSIDQMMQYSPVKLRRQHAQLDRTVACMRTRIRHMKQYTADLHRRHAEETGQLKSHLEQDQLKGAAQLQHAQKQYEQVYALLQSAESAHASLVSRLYTVEHTQTATAESHQQLFEQYQMQLAREQQEKQQIEQKLRQAEQQIKQQQATIHAMQAQIDQSKHHPLAHPNSAASPLAPSQPPPQSQPHPQSSPVVRPTPHRPALADAHEAQLDSHTTAPGPHSPTPMQMHQLTHTNSNIPTNTTKSTSPPPTHAHAHTHAHSSPHVSPTISRVTKVSQPPSTRMAHRACASTMH